MKHHHPVIRITTALLLLLLALAGRARAASAGASAIDTLVLGDPASERAHQIGAAHSDVVQGGLGEPARRLLPLNPVSFDGGSVAGQSVPMQDAFDLCVRKTRSNIKRLADEPKSAANAVEGNYFSHPEGFFEIGNWTSSFFTGMALLAYRSTREAYFRQQVERLAPVYRQKVEAPEYAAETMHDLGFLYTLYSVALYKLTGNPEHRRVGLKDADVLAARFIRQGRYGRSATASCSGGWRS